MLMNKWPVAGQAKGQMRLHRVQLRITHIIVDEDVLPAVSTAPHVVNRARMLRSHDARHGASMPSLLWCVKH